MTSAESVQRLAAEVREQMHRLGLKQASIPAAGGPSPATIRGLFAAAAAGRPFKDMQLDTLAKFDRAMKWEPGSARDVLAGGKPRLLADQRVGVIRGHDPEWGEVRIAVPAHVVAALDGLSDLERAEAEAEAVARLLVKIRELHASR